MGERNSSVNSLKVCPACHARRICSLNPRSPVGEVPPLSEVRMTVCFGLAEHDLLRRDFGFGIDAQRIDGSGLVVIARATVEDQVGGQEDQRNLCRQLGEQGGDFDVELAGQRGVGLAFGTLAERGAVDDELRLLAAKRCAHGGRSPSGQGGRG